jgi:hypothetical protein
VPPSKTKLITNIMGWGMAQVVKLLVSKHKTKFKTQYGKIIIKLLFAQEHGDWHVGKLYQEHISSKSLNFKKMF